VEVEAAAIDDAKTKVIEKIERARKFHDVLVAGPLDRLNKGGINRNVGVKSEQSSA
jgi:hypothetical protein